jgi:hypothetical protein
MLVDRRAERSALDALMLYGEWLRRRGEARDQLRAAYEIFVSAGAGAFAERARTEPAATGERAPSAPRRRERP